MGFYAGDTYNFILNIPSSGIGTDTVTSAPLITVLDINNPGSPIVSGQAMTLITGTGFIYFYAFAAPNASPKDYVAIYSYATQNSQAAGIATTAYWNTNGTATFKFNLPLPQNAARGNKLNTVGFTPSGFNLTGVTVSSVDQVNGLITVPLASNPGTPQSFNLTGNAQIIAGVPNIATVQLTQITNGLINVGDSITIASATTSALNGSFIVRTADFANAIWTITFDTTGGAFASTPQSAGVLTENTLSLATVMGTGSALNPKTVSNQMISLTDQFHIGDSFITGQVALNSTVAQNSTVAKDATVMKSSQYVAPSNDSLVQQIGSATQTILTNSNNEIALLGTLSEGTLSGLIQDVYDNLFGSWTIDQTANPPVLYIKRINGSIIASFQLLNSNSSTQRNVLTSPAESSV